MYDTGLQPFAIGVKTHNRERSLTYQPSLIPVPSFRDSRLGCSKYNFPVCRCKYDIFNPKMISNTQDQQYQILLFQEAVRIAPVLFPRTRFHKVALTNSTLICVRSLPQIFLARFATDSDLPPQTFALIEAESQGGFYTWDFGLFSRRTLNVDF